MENVYISVADLSSCMQEKYFKNKDMISIDDLLWVFDQLDSDYEKLKEEYEDFKEDVESNYKPINQSEAIGYDGEW